MYDASEHLREIKRKLRDLKKLELKIRFGDTFHAANIKGVSLERPPGIPLIWDGFFEVNDKPVRGEAALSGAGKGKARYSLGEIAAMSREEYRNVIDEFFFNVYYKYYTENGITGARLYDPEILGRMGLPADAGAEDVKRRFRELAKKYHPDVGGNETVFIELMENYRKLTE